MKKTILAIAAVLAAVMPLSAQKSGLLGTKRSIVSVEVENECEFNIFSYEKDGDRAYYLGLCSNTFDDVFVFIGKTSAEASAGMEKISGMFSAKEGTVKEFPAIHETELANGDGMKTVKISAVKKTASKKIQLRFDYPDKDGQLTCYMQQSTAKTLIKFITSYNKRHPDR